MEITPNLIPLIEAALKIKLYPRQVSFLVGEAQSVVGGRGTGKTVAYCIKLALTDGPPLNGREFHSFSDYGDGTRKYSETVFKRVFLDIRQRLKDHGFPVRDIKK